LDKEQGGFFISQEVLGKKSVFVMRRKPDQTNLKNPGDWRGDEGNRSSCRPFGRRWIMGKGGEKQGIPIKGTSKGSSEGLAQRCFWLGKGNSQEESRPGTHIGKLGSKKGGQSTTNLSKRKGGRNGRGNT